jgi:dTMP kinase
MTRFRRIAQHPPDHDTPGLLCVVEGPDAVGKTTVAGEITAALRLRGAFVLPVRMPTSLVRDSSLFQAAVRRRELDRVDFEALQLLHAADRVQQTAKTLLPMLSAGGVVVCDRYYQTSIVTMLARRGQIFSWYDQILTRLLRPDLTVVLSCSYEAHARRVSERNDKDDHPHSEDAFATLVEAYSALADSDARVLQFDTTGQPSLIVSQIALSRLGEVRRPGPRLL